MTYAVPLSLMYRYEFDVKRESDTKIPDSKDGPDWLETALEHTGTFTRRSSFVMAMLVLSSTKRVLLVTTSRGSQ